MNLLSIQSHVAYGHVGNSAAVFPLQRLGIEVWPIHTVQFSNHTGYGAWRGRVFDAALIREVVDGHRRARRARRVRRRAVRLHRLRRDRGGDPAMRSRRVKHANPAAHYCCDPVIGDVGRGVFVRPDIPEFMRERAMPAADIVTPNQFELEQLTGRTVTTLADDDGRRGRAACARSADRRRHLAAHAGDAAGRDRHPRLRPECCFRVRTPRLPVTVNGAGDAIAALFFGHFLRRRPGARGARPARSPSIFGVLRATAEAGSREILLVEAQEEIVAPSLLVDAEDIRR